MLVNRVARPLYEKNNFCQSIDTYWWNLVIFGCSGTIYDIQSMVEYEFAGLK